MRVTRLSTMWMAAMAVLALLALVAVGPGSAADRQYKFRIGTVWKHSGQ